MAYPRDTSLKSQFADLDTKEIHQLMECMSICKACSKKCIEEGFKRQALLCQDCSEICDLAIKLKSYNSEYCQRVLELCAQVCRQCANECSRMQSAHCQECAEACRHCAEACSLIPIHH
jgi:hypothetical protein